MVAKGKASSAGILPFRRRPPFQVTNRAEDPNSSRVHLPSIRKHICPFRA